MIKGITLLTKFILIALTALFFGSCNHMGNLQPITGSGNVTTEKRTIHGNFKSIEVNNAVDLIVEQSDSTEIIVEADDNLQKEITTTIKNGVLVISCSNNFNNITSKKVIVRMPEIEGLEATSTATIESKNTLKGNNISVSTSSAASLNIALEFESIQSECSSGSTQTIQGKTLNLETTASSGGQFEAGNLFANTIIAKASSGGSIEVHPIVSLKAHATSGGTINYNSVPKSIQKNSNSGGTINLE